MAETNKGGAAGAFVEKYGEKLALGIAVLLLAAYAVVGIALAKPDKSADDVDKKIVDIQNEQRRLHETPPAPADLQSKIPATWNTVPAVPASGPDWSGALLTKIEVKENIKPVKPPVQAIAPEVTIGTAEVNIDNVKVSWSLTEFTKKQLADALKENKEYVKLSGLTLERKVGAGTWEKLAEDIDLKTTTYTDSKIEPKSKYQYRITAATKEKAFLDRGGPGALPKGSGIVNVSEGAPVTTLGIWKLSFTSPSKPANAAKGMVYVKIEKFEKGHGKVEKSRIHYAGDRIGWWEETPGAEPVSAHRISLPGGRSIEVDLNTGAELKSVEPVKLVLDLKRQKPKYEGGSIVGYEEVIEKRPFDTHLIIYKDDEGEKRIYSPDPKTLTEPKAPPPPPAPGTTAKPDETAPPDPKVLAAQKKEADAEKLYVQADTAFAKGEKSALGLFTRLLGEFKDTDFVSKQKKSIIEERIASIKAQK